MYQILVQDHLMQPYAILCVGFIVSTVQIGNGVSTHKSVSLSMVVLVPQLGGLRIMKLYSFTVLEVEGPESRCQVSHITSEDLEKEIVLPCFFQLPLVANNSWHYMVYDPVIPVGVSIVTRLSMLCLSSFSYKDTSNIEFSVHLNSA